MTKSQYNFLSGKKIAKILCKNFDFYEQSQKGSHLKLKNSSAMTIIPLHKVIQYGTFRSILQLAKISEQEFYDAQIAREIKDISRTKDRNFFTVWFNCIK